MHERPVSIGRPPVLLAALAHPDDGAFHRGKARVRQ